MTADYTPKIMLNCKTGLTRRKDNTAFGHRSRGTNALTHFVPPKQRTVLFGERGTHPCKGERHQTATAIWYSELYLSPQAKG